jgi:hypothetical protein
MSLVAKHPYPPWGDWRTSKYLRLKRVPVAFSGRETTAGSVEGAEDLGGLPVLLRPDMKRLVA